MQCTYISFVSVFVQIKSIHQITLMTANTKFWFGIPSKLQIKYLQTEKINVRIFSFFCIWWKYMNKFKQSGLKVNSLWLGKSNSSIFRVQNIFNIPIVEQCWSISKFIIDKFHFPVLSDFSHWQNLNRPLNAKCQFIQWLSQNEMIIWPGDLQLVLHKSLASQSRNGHDLCALPCQRYDV